MKLPHLNMNPTTKITMNPPRTSLQEPLQQQLQQLQQPIQIGDSNVAGEISNNNPFKEPIEATQQLTDGAKQIAQMLYDFGNELKKEVLPDIKEEEFVPIILLVIQKIQNEQVRESIRKLLDEFLTIIAEKSDDMYEKLNKIISGFIGIIPVIGLPANIVSTLEMLLNILKTYGNIAEKLGYTVNEFAEALNSINKNGVDINQLKQVNSIPINNSNLTTPKVNTNKLQKGGRKSLKHNYPSLKKSKTLKHTNLRLKRINHSINQLMKTDKVKHHTK